MDIEVPSDEIDHPIIDDKEWEDDDVINVQGITSHKEKESRLPRFRVVVD